MTFTTNNPQATSTRRRHLRTLLVLPAAALSVALSGWALPATAQTVAPAPATRTAPAQQGTMQLQAEHPAGATEPMEIQVTGGTPGELVLLDAKHSGNSGSSATGEAQLDGRGNGRVQLQAPADGWYAGSYLFFATMPEAAASGFLELPPQLGKTVPELTVSPERYPEGALGSAGVRVTGLEPGERVTVTSSRPGVGTDIIGPEVTLHGDEQGVAVGDVPAVAGGFQPGQNYDLTASTGRNAGVGRFLMPH